MIRYLLDTNAISEPVRPMPHPRLLAFLEEHRTTCAISSVTWHESLFGVARLPDGRRREALQAYLFEVVKPALPILPYDERAAAWHARERARLIGAGRTPSFADAQIAAVAATQGLMLVTANTADFECYPDVQLWSWTSAGG